MQSGNPKWTKGMESPNKEGVNNPIPVTVRDYARRHTMTAMRTLVNNCQHGRTGSIQNQAAMGLLAYGWGRPPQLMQIETPEGIGLAATVLAAYSHSINLLDSPHEMELVSGVNVTNAAKTTLAAEILPPNKKRRRLKED